MVNDFNGLAEGLDRILTVHFARVENTPRKIKLYDAARAKIKEPLTQFFGRNLLDKVKENDNVIIATGAVAYPWEVLGETDGPSGAAVLARALDIGLGAKPIIICEEVLTGVLQSVVRGSGLQDHSYKDFRGCPHSVNIQGFPTDSEKAKVEADRILNEYNPAAIIAIEKMGPNKKGIYHTMTGNDVTRFRAKVHYLFEKAQECKIFTGGIGDGGNELGCGNIYNEAREILPLGKKCNCPCGDGVVTVTKADALLMANVSNFGAYALAAMIGALTDKPEALHDRATHQRILANQANAGCVDGSTILRIPAEDGNSEQACLAFIDLLREMIDSPLAPLWDARQKHKLT